MRGHWNVAAVFLALLLAGCAGMPNHVAVSESTFDGSIQVRQKPGFVSPGEFRMAPNFNLGLTWNSKMDDQVLIVAVNYGEITSLRSREGLQFNIDGEIVALSSPDVLTDVDFPPGTTLSETSKAYVADLALVERLITADDVRVKLVTGDGYLEGVLTHEVSNAAIHGFRDAYSRIQEIRQQRLASRET